MSLEGLGYRTLPTGPWHRGDQSYDAGDPPHCRPYAYLAAGRMLRSLG